MEMKNVTLSDAFTQEELQCYFNIREPKVCPTHHKPATLSYKDDIFKLNVCCNELLVLVRLQISERIAKRDHEL